MTTAAYNAIIGSPIYSDVGVSFSPALSGGSWLSALPLTNLQDRRLHKVARSTDATAANTKIIVDLGTARAISVLAVLIPNFTKSATPTIQWKGGTTSGASDVYAPAAFAPWPTGATAEDVAGTNVWFTVVPSTTQTARFWELDIVDTANADGHLDVARIVIAGGTQTTVNVAQSAKDGFETETEKVLTDGGAAIYTDRPRRRTLQGAFPNLPVAEGFTGVRKYQRLLGISGQFFWVFDPTDTTLMYERAYLACFKELSALDYAFAVHVTTPFSIVEEL